MIDGDKDAFIAIYHKHYKALYYYAFSITADREFSKDCIQELFLDIWNKRQTLNNDVENVQSYLFTWLRRKISRKQSQQLKVKFIEQTGTVDELKEYSYEDLLIAFQQTEETKEQLKKALNMLTKKQLEIIKLKFFENLSYNEIAEKTSLSIRTVYNLVHEAINRLKENITVIP